jgi:predicted metal-dependent phosphotriesterase family hydrolase
MLPALREAGLSDDALTQLFEQNPARFLAR